MFFLLGAASGLFGGVEEGEILGRLKGMGGHPRLFWRGEVERSPVVVGLIRRAEGMLGEAPVERIQIGRRLLDKSRTCLSRVLHLGLAWRVTGERKYAERARKEMLAVAAFSDWNPSHFLDVAEMTAALGIGYDWLYEALDEQDRRVIREAIVEKGLKPSLTSNSWSKSTHNWNQVCNAGMAIGAIAVADSEPELAARMVARAINTVPAAMAEYAPDGAYPEGTSYWGYGTSFNVLLIDALKTALGSDFGLTQAPGFLATADYMLHMYGPEGLPFNFGDAGAGRTGLLPAMFWFAAVRGEPYLLWSEWAKLQEGVPAQGDRLDPLLPVWMGRGLTQPPKPAALSWTGGGAMPVALHRSGWERGATFVGVKGGSPSVNHAHMDVGSFVMDALGTRWADDFGMQSYHSLESAGIALWGREQGAERWQVFRLGTSAHNVLMVNGEQQRVAGHARVVEGGAGRSVVDLGPVYAGQLEAARRGVTLRGDGAVVVEDDVKALGKARVRWAMVTRAEVRVEGPGRARLTREGRALTFRVVEPAGVEVRVYQTDPPPRATDAANPETRMLGFEVELGAGAAGRMVVELAPERIGSGGPGED